MPAIAAFVSTVTPKDRAAAAIAAVMAPIPPLTMPMFSWGVKVLHLM